MQSPALRSFCAGPNSAAPASEDNEELEGAKKHRTSNEYGEADNEDPGGDSPVHSPGKTSRKGKTREWGTAEECVLDDAGSSVSFSLTVGIEGKRVLMNSLVESELTFCNGAKLDVASWELYDGEPRCRWGSPQV